MDETLVLKNGEVAPTFLGVRALNLINYFSYNYTWLASWGL
jgi:hypothetical protein